MKILGFYIFKQIVWIVTPYQKPKNCVFFASSFTGFSMTFYYTSRITDLLGIWKRIISKFLIIWSDCSLISETNSSGSKSKRHASRNDLLQMLYLTKKQTPSFYQAGYQDSVACLDLIVVAQGSRSFLNCVSRMIFSNLQIMFS